MFDEEVVDALPKLGIAAARMLIYREFNQGRPISREEYCRVCGLTYGGYHKAKRLLRSLGLSERLDTQSERTFTTSERPFTPGERLDTYEVNTSTLRDEADALDAWPGDGDVNQHSSPFQERRRQQVKLLQRAWREFGLDEKGMRPLSEAACRTWLGWFEESSRTILGYIEQAALLKQDGQVRFPYGWLNSVLNRNRERAQQPQHAPAAPLPSAVRRAPSTEEDVEPGSKYSSSPDPEPPELELERLHKLERLGFSFNVDMRARKEELEALVAA